MAGQSHIPFTHVPPTAQAATELGNYKKKILELRRLNQKHRKQKCLARKKIRKLSKLFEELKEKFKITEENIKRIKSCLGEMGLDVFQHLKKNQNKNKYPEEIRKFTLTLFAYSPKTYAYLRKYLPLPHARTLTKWLSVIDGNPGITKEAIGSVKRKIAESKHPLVFALMLDEMAIKKQIEWDGKQHVGFVNLGENIDDDTLPVASNALVYLLVPLNSNWKAPVAYYLTDGLTGEVLANLTNNLLTHLHDNSINVCVLVVVAIRACYLHLGFVYHTH